MNFLPASLDSRVDREWERSGQQQLHTWPRRQNYQLEPVGGATEPTLLYGGEPVETQLHTESFHPASAEPSPGLLFPSSSGF